MKPNILQRVWKEVKDANADFYNLRTVISPDTTHDDASRFDFMMLPNDGAMAHLTLVGVFFIPDEYPESPPVVQLYTPTQRFNVDAYQCVIGSSGPPRSSMCFDILRSPAQGGSWKSEFTISCLFASLMSAIVSLKVAQQSGGSREEYVSMEKLARVKKGAKYVFDQHAHHLPPVPSIPLVEATMVPAKPLFDPQTLEAGNPETIVSRPIYLQTGTDEVHSFAVDLSALHPDIIFSIVLSNTPGTDLAGKQSTTILVRNGVTATAARKSVGKKTKWFYHGKPMNDGDMRLFVSVGRDQMTFAYQEGGKWCVHGDCPVSKLKERDIGYVKRMPFYVTVYTKNKGTLKKEEEPAVVRFLDTQGQGWIHDGVEDEEEVAEELELEEEVEESDGGFEIIGHEEAREEQGAQEDEGLLGGLEGMSL